MKRVIIVALILMFTAGTMTAFAAGVKNQGTTGTGEKYSGTTSQGTASQPRTGK
jgi:uncharacterized protein YdeI (BOF family)